VNRGFTEQDIANFMVKIIGQNTRINHQKITESLILVQSGQVFPEIIPAILLDHIQPYKYRAGKLFIATDHGIYAQQLHYYQNEIVKNLKEKVNPGIQKIEIHTGKLYTKNHKTKDIMSQNEKLSQNPGEVHENSKIIEQLISEVKKIQSNKPQENI